MLRWTQHGRPEVRAAARWVRRRDLGHAQRHEKREEADDDPSDGHDTRATRRQAKFDWTRSMAGRQERRVRIWLRTEGSDASDDALPRRQYGNAATD